MFDAVIAVSIFVALHLPEHEKLPEHFAVLVEVGPDHFGGLAVVQRNATARLGNEHAHPDVEPFLLKREAKAARSPIGRVHADV